MSEDSFLVVADTTDIDLGQSQSVHVNGVDILICHTEEGLVLQGLYYLCENKKMEGLLIQFYWVT